MTAGSRRAGAFGLAALALTLTGCATATEADRPEPSTAAPTPAAATSPAATPTPDESPAETPSEPVPSAEDEPEDEATAGGGSGKVTLRDRLLTADQVPTLSGSLSWTEAATRGKEGRRPFGTCQKFAMTSIGASSVQVRTFEPATSGSTAGNLVASFADEMTAKRAFEVLKSWRGQCEEELQRYDRRDVGDLRAVPGATGDAGWYLLTYGPATGNADESYFDAQGLARVGSRITLVQLRLIGQDYNFEAGKEPMVEAVRSAAAELG